MFLCEIVEEINANKDGEREHCGRPDTVPKQNMDEQITGERIGEITENIGANFCCMFLLHVSAALVSLPHKESCRARGGSEKAF